VLLGDVHLAAASHQRFFSLWKKFGLLPERYLLVEQAIHPTERYYPLRPELAESTYALYEATRDPWCEPSPHLPTSLQAMSLGLQVARHGSARENKVTARRAKHNNGLARSSSGGSEKS
jgi:hypothetical protein